MGQCKSPLLTKILPKIHPVEYGGSGWALGASSRAGSPLSRADFCSFSVALRWPSLFQAKQQRREEKRGKKSVLFLLINRAAEKGSVFHSVVLTRPVFPSPYQSGNVLRRRYHETQRTGRHYHVCLCKIMSNFKRSEYYFSCGSLGFFSSLNTDLVAGGCSLTSGLPGSSQEKWFSFSRLCGSLF